jgi:hypothetical protein
LLNANKLTVEEIAGFFDVPLEYVKKLSEEIKK